MIQETQLSLTNSATHLCNMRGWPLKHDPSPYLLPRRIWSFFVKRCRHKQRGIWKIGKHWNSTPWDGGAAYYQETRPSPNVFQCRIWLL